MFNIATTYNLGQRNRYHLTPCGSSSYI